MRPVLDAEGGSRQVRTVAVFHCTARVGSAWGCAEGIVTTLAALGYRVLDCGNPKFGHVPVEVLREADLIILSALEWYDDILAARYGQAWFDLPACKVAWYAESAYRDDRNFPFARCRRLADRHYFPACQDAREFGGDWLPFGADIALFSPRPGAKQFDAAFLGSMYPKRLEYIRNIRYDLTYIRPVAAATPIESFDLLAKAYSSTRIFVNLPSYSRLLVTKVTEVMACRTMLVTPAIDHPSGIDNMAQFTDGEHLVFYRPDRPWEIGEIIEHYLRHAEEREAIAEAGWREVCARHTLRHRIERIMGDVQPGGWVQPSLAHATSG